MHLDLFEVIKSAITSTENGGAISDIDVVDEPEKEVTNNVLTGSVVGEIRDAAKVDTTPLNNIEGILRRMIVSVTSLSQRQQILLALFVLFIVTRTVLFLGGTTQNQTKISSSGPEVFDVLAQRVEDLTKEVGEMKAILEQIYLRMEEESSNHRDEL